MKTIDITNFSDNTIDAILAYRSGDESFNFDVLTSRELRDLQKATGADLGTWIVLEENREARERAATRRNGRDYESAILAYQERAFAD